MLKKYSLATAALCLVLPAAAQNDGKTSLKMEDVLSGKSIPQSLRVKDLNSDYRRVRFLAPEVLMMGGRGSNRDLSIFYTKGQSVTFGGMEYLAAYRPETQTNANWNNHGQAQVVLSKLRPNDKLLLALLSTQGFYGSSLTDIRPFDPEEDMETEADRNNAVQQTLRQLGAGIMQWKHSRGQERLPRWTNRVTDALRRQCYPVVHDKRLWEHPSSGEAFGLNPALANQRVPDMTNRQWIYMAYEFTPTADGARAVLFADGHVERVDAERWSRMLKTPIQTKSSKSASKPAAQQRREMP